MENKKRKTGIKKPGVMEVALFLAFFAPFALMLAIFAGNGIYPFGNRSFLTSDMYHQYMPFFQEFYKKICAGEGLAYSWNVGMGSNFLALFVYYLASPLNWLAFLFPLEHLMEFMSYLVVLKIGFMGLCAFIYLKYRRGNVNTIRNSFFSLALSVFYAMSGFIAAYNWNIMWLDCIVLLPLILLGLERLVYQKKAGMYCAFLALSILTNFYISIMICIFLVLYFLFFFLTEEGKLAMFLRFSLASLAAGGLAGILLIPEVCALMATDFGSMILPENWESYFSVLEILERHCMGITTERALEHWPNIYCGTVVFLLVPLYAMNEKIPMRRRFGFLALAGVFLLSFGTNIPDYIWHGLNYPDSLPARQSFIYILLVLIMCHDCLVHEDGVPVKAVLKTYLGAVVVFLLIERYGESDDFQTWTWLMNLAFVTVYAICLHLSKTRKGMVAQYVVGMLAFVAVLAECAINMSLTSVGTTDRKSYLKDLQAYCALYERNAVSDDDFQRVEKFTRKTKNDATLAGFPSASVFSSTMNSYVMDFYTKFGMHHSKVFYGYDGATAFSAALLNVGFMFGESDEYENALYELIDSEGGLYLYRAKYTLPFGYVLPYGFDLPEGMDDQSVSIQNELADQLGAEGLLLKKVNAERDGDDVVFTAQQDGIYYGCISAGGTKKLKVTGGTPEEQKYKDLKKGCLVYLGFLEEGQTITLTNGDDEDETPKVSATIHQLNLDCLEEVIGKLKERHMTDVKVDNTNVSGKITLEEPGRVVLSIPYEKGWTVRVNQQETTPERFGEAFLALDLEAGEYEIRLQYEPKGRKAGILVSLCTMTVLALTTAGIRFMRKREKTSE